MAAGGSHHPGGFKPLDVFGEVELFAFDHYNLSVQALTEAACLSLPVSAIRRAADRNSRLFAYLCGRLGAKLEARVISGAINLRYPVANRFASYLLAAADRRGGVLGTDDLGDIASFLGASYRQLARVVRRFRDEGLLKHARGQIRILDKSRLVPLAIEQFA